MSANRSVPYPTCQRNRFIVDGIVARRGPTQVATEEILRLASGQYGVISRSQIIDLGFSATMVKNRVLSHRLERIYPGVYCIGLSSLPREAFWLAALMSAGPDCALSHRSAAAHWGFLANPGPIEILRRSSPDGPRSRSISSLGVNAPPVLIHRSRRFEETEVTIHNGIRVTTVARALLNIASTSSLAQLESALNEAERLHLVEINDLKRQVDRGRGWKGISKLRIAVERWDPSKLETRSELEVAFLGMCQDFGIQLPEVNIQVEGYLVDCYWPTARTIVELDGYRYHSDLPQFKRDRRRTLALEKSGFRVFRLSHEMVTKHASETAEAIKSHLSRRTGSV